MVVSRLFEPPDLVAATVAGVVTYDDQAALTTFVRAAIHSAGTVRLLLRLEHFAVWYLDDRFDRDVLWLRDDEGVAKIAVVGDPSWRVPVLTLMAQPLRRVPIEYFLTEEAARCWLERPTRAPTPAPA